MSKFRAVRQTNIKTLEEWLAEEGQTSNPLEILSVNVNPQIGNVGDEFVWTVKTNKKVEGSIKIEFLDSKRNCNIVYGDNFTTDDKAKENWTYKKIINNRGKNRKFRLAISDVNNNKIIEHTDSFTIKNLLENTIDKIIVMRDVQAGYPDANGNINTTWCNRAALRILCSMHYDTNPILDVIPGTNIHSENYTTANDIARNASFPRADNKITEVTEEEARNLANQNIPILAAAHNPVGHGHVGIVYPSDDNRTMIGQAGKINGVLEVKQAFGSLSDNVKYHRLKKKK